MSRPALLDRNETAAELQVCTRCIMDRTDPDIEFDADGVCNHCRRFDELARSRLLSGEVAQTRLKDIVSRIKAIGRAKPYDCVIGVSGGVDSTYVAYLVKQLGLRPLAVHLDNGWDSELAVKNIERTLKVLDIDLYTYVIDWEEFRDLQLAFLRASTPDAEVPTDHAIIAILYQVAAKHNLHHILLGTNVVTESILPLKWGYGYFDWKYIRSVHKRLGTRRLATYPHFGLFKLAYYALIKRIRIVPILNYVEYDKQTAMQIIEDKLDWIYYGGKHYESIYTRFFQSYILPRKFNIDKRKAHYSNLVCAGQWTRQQAVEAMTQEDNGAAMIEEDKTYAIKKLGISPVEFERIMRMSTKTFLDYPNHFALFEAVKRARRLVLVN